jgi:hypothetical protein
MNRVRAMPAEPVAGLRIRRPPSGPRDPIWSKRLQARHHDLTPHSDRFSVRTSHMFVLLWLTAQGKSASVPHGANHGNIITFIKPAFHRLPHRHRTAIRPGQLTPFPMKTQPARSPTLS